jgi:hypothetical protein
MSGVPEDILPPEFLRTTRSVEKNYGQYFRVQGVRDVAKLVPYGAPAVHRSMLGMQEISVTLLHTFEELSINAVDLMALLKEDTETDGIRQQLGRQTLDRNLKEFGQRFRNLRVSSVYSALATGQINFNGADLMPAGQSGATTSVDFGVTAYNKGTCDVFGDGDPAFNANWDTVTTDILGQIKTLKKKARQKTGRRIKCGFYGTNIPGYMARNNAIGNMIRGSSEIAKEFSTAEIGRSVGQIDWYPIDEAFFVDQNGNIQEWFSPDAIVFTPDPKDDWYELLEGTYPVPRNINLVGDGLACLANIQEQAGAFSYARVADNPVGIRHFGGDTMLPIIRVPDCIYQAIVPTMANGLLGS